jgi:hypothetical protein
MKTNVKLHQTDVKLFNSEMERGMKNAKNNSMLEYILFSSIQLFFFFLSILGWGETESTRYVDH